MSIFDKRREEAVERKYDFAARLILMYGSLQKGLIPEEKLEELWGDEYYPCAESLSKRFNTQKIKWYIHNKIECDDPVWNGDFIQGFIKAGRIKWNNRAYPKFEWWGSTNLLLLLEESPFRGKVRRPQREGNRAFVWSQAPALYLKGKTNTLSYIAGLLATGKKYKLNGEIYAMYKYPVMEELEKFGIPIVAYAKINVKPLISPFFPALFTKFMPEPAKDYWFDIKKAHLAKETAAILWSTYVSGTKFERQAIPYLQARRTIFNYYKTDEGLIKNLQRLRVKNNLTEVAPQIRECIRLWYQDYLKGEENEVSTH